MIKIIAMETPSMSNPGKMERIEDVEKIREYFYYPDENYSDDEIFYGFHITVPVIHDGKPFDKPKFEEEPKEVMPFCIDDLIREGEIWIGNCIHDVPELY